MNPVYALLAANVLALAACSSTPPTPDHGHPSPTPTTEVSRTRVIELPTSVGPGQPKEARVLMNEAPLKLATIILRGGTTMPEHAAPVPVTILALSGAGVITVGDERLPVDAGHAVFLGADVVHAVVPDPGTDLVLVVHHLGQGAEHHGGEDHR